MNKEIDTHAGEVALEIKRDIIIRELYSGADQIVYAIDEKLEYDIEQLHKAASELKAKVAKTIEYAENRPVFDVIRKYWNTPKEKIAETFVYNTMKDKTPFE